MSCGGINSRRHNLMGGSALQAPLKWKGEGPYSFSGVSPGELVLSSVLTCVGFLEYQIS